MSYETLVGVALLDQYGRAVSDAERQQAVRTVACHARDADDLTLLLDALGLDPREGTTK